MWPEVKQAKDENRYELILTGTDVNKRIESEGHLDPELYELSQLNFLRVSKTPLTTLHDNLSRLVNLTSLILQSNQLQSLPGSLGKLAKLKVLDLSFNVLQDLPEEIGQLTNLSTLNLCTNKISAFPSTVKGCVCLAVLDISYNALTEFPAICEESLVHLADVKLNDNQITEVPSTVSALQSLKVLDLGNNLLKTVPGELADCVKLKDINLRGNPLSDRHFKKVVEAERSTPKQVLGNIKQHCPRTSTAEDVKEGKGKGKKGKRGKGKGREDDQVDEICKEIQVLSVQETCPLVIVSSNVRDIRPYIVCCVLHNVDLTGENFKKFISAQTRLHDGICEKRMVATIATHDMTKIKSPLTLVARNPDLIRIHPLVRGKEVSGQELYDGLAQEAEAQRKQQKRNNVSGIHKFLHLVKEWENWPCLVNADGTVISLPPITNSENTKIVPETTTIFVEVTSSTSLNAAKAVMDALILSSLNIDISTNETSAGKSCLKVQQVRVEDEEGNLRVIYPSRTDLIFENEAVRVVAEK